MKAFLFFLGGLVLIAGGFFGGKLFEKPQVINSFSFPASMGMGAQKDSSEYEIKRLRELNDLADKVLEQLREKECAEKYRK